MIICIIFTFVVINIIIIIILLTLFVIALVSAQIVIDMVRTILKKNLSLFTEISQESPNQPTLLWNLVST